MIALQYREESGGRRRAGAAESRRGQRHHQRQGERAVRRPAECPQRNSAAVDIGQARRRTSQADAAGATEGGERVRYPIDYRHYLIFGFVLTARFGSLIHVSAAAVDKEESEAEEEILSDEPETDEEEDEFDEEEEELGTPRSKKLKKKKKVKSCFLDEEAQDSEIDSAMEDEEDEEDQEVERG